jgi:hypothetical protein
LTLCRDIDDGLAGDGKVEGELVSATRILTLRVDLRRVEVTAVTRVAVVVEDDFAVQLLEGH